MNLIDKSCVTLNSINDTTKWTNNSSFDPINAYSVVFPPLLTYFEGEEYLSESGDPVFDYTYCGPLIILMKTFAQYINTEIRFNYHGLNGETHGWVDAAFSAQHDVGVNLIPYSPMFAFENTIRYFNIVISRYVSGFDGNVIIARTHKSAWPLFSFFQCWDSYFYAWIFVFLLTIGIVFSFKNRSIIHFSESFWNFSSVILSKAMENNTKNKAFRGIAGIWLLTSVVLLSVYSGGLYNFIIRRQQTETIDDLEDLFTAPYWRQSKVYCMYFIGNFEQMLTAYIYKTDDLLVKLFERTEMLDTFEMIFNPETSREIFNEIMKENSVFMTNGLFAHYFINKLKAESLLFRQYEEGFDYSISEFRNMKCYFLNLDLDVFGLVNLKHLNRIISKLQENGIYDFEVRKSYDYQSSDHRFDVNENGIEDLNFQQLKGVFLLLIIGLSAAIFCISSEIIFYLVKLLFD